MQSRALQVGRVTRMKPKYKAKPSAIQKAYHQWLMDTFGCFCGCERRSTVVHHPLTRHPQQQWRRDHEFVVPMYWACHVALHQCGSEQKYRPDLDFADGAYHFRQQGLGAGQLKVAA